MKKLLFFLFVCSCFSAGAQLQRGQWLVGGSADFLYSGSNNSANEVSVKANTTSLQLPVQGGFFVLNQIVAGIRGGVLFSKNRQEIKGRILQQDTYSLSSDRTFGYVVGPFVRYYFFQPEHRLNIFADISYGYSHSKDKSKSFQSMTNPADPLGVIVNSSEKKHKYNAGIYTVSVGPAFFIKTFTSLELSVGYSYKKYTKSPTTSHNLSLSAGFQVYLGK